MASRMYKKCTVCNTRRVPGSDVFLAALPLDPARCRLWVQAIGQEDLVHLPIEKLHTLKYVCAIHFAREDFNKQGNRLRQSAVPMFRLPLPPLPEAVFVDFPLHVGWEKEKHQSEVKVHLMDAAHLCRCCLRRAPDKGLTTPYTYLGATEIYSDMLKECFDIQLTLGSHGECGICVVCVGRLRDASHFKLQVARSQAELQRLQGEMHIKDEPAVKLETTDDEEMEAKCDMFYVVTIEKSDAIEDETAVEVSHEDTLVKLEMPDEGDMVTKDVDLSAPDTVRIRHEGDTYICDNCREQFTDKSNLINHINRVHMKFPVTYYCETCSKEFSRKDLFVKHIDRSAKKTYSCEMCSMRFAIKSVLKEHIRTHANQKASSEVCDKDNAGLKRKRIAKSNRYICDVCNRHCVSKSILELHRRVHTGEKPYACEVCHKRFAFKNSFKAHTRIHTGERPYSCNECDRKFRQKSALNVHKRTHTGHKPYDCDECRKQFAAHGGLNVHKCVHIRPQPYKCEECHKRFTQKGSLDKHKKIHTGVKPYSCEECNKQFKEKYDLQVHTITHTGEKAYACEVCQRQFSRKHHLLSHIRTHTGEKPYGCEICKKKFAQKATLDMHKKIHTGVKEYNCDVCHKQFTQRSTFQRHKKIHT